MFVKCSTIYLTLSILQYLKKNKLKKPLTVKSAHYNLWIEGYSFSKQATLIDKTSKKEGKNFLSLKNWIMTIENVKKLWNIVHKQHGFTQLQTKFLNQNPQENFLGNRSLSSCNGNPTPSQFTTYFTILLISKFSNAIINHRIAK